MKNYFSKVVFLLLLLFITRLHSQEQISIGIRGTVHTSNVSEIHVDSKALIGGSLGGSVKFPLGYDNQFYINAELAYSMQGEKDGSIKYAQNYVNIPIYFRAYFSEADSEFFGEIGPQIGILVSQKNKELDEAYYGDKPQTLDLSIGAGMGYSFSRKFEIFARYNYGLTDVYKKYQGQQRTSILGFGVTYYFNSY
ncbi:PorT family protein [Apibacter muscae]|uniref:PorT family protein n=1 Tax=Apibacter muscae TaxID=2509004 RepID=A0A563D7H9_9FLAO|nr:porin family protein [Apibacter muscae]TWP22932.1 PorT family protein [Apibacter muscae]TWP26186.1 PorT family protein [Apibacter muscae]TWP28029.1 PorT family protein [Apibacter muscae]